MNTIDIIVVSVYLIGLFGWAIYIGLKETAEDYLVLSRSAPFVLVAFSVISTWVGTGTTVATAASGYDTGISLGFTAVGGGIVGILVAAWFAPRLKWFGDKFRAHTIGDFFSTRYSRNSRFAASALILSIYILLTAAQFVGLSTLLHVWTGIQFEIVIWFAALSTIAYTAFAGIKSDFYTDVVHFIVMFFAIFLILLPLTLGDIGGLSALQTLPDSYFDPFAYGGLSFFIAGLIFGAGSVFVTMEVWQRVYASASAKIAQRALLLSVIIIVSFYVVSSFFGMAAHIVNPNLVNRDQAIFFLMKEYLPAGVLGLGLAGFMAVFISTVNSTIMVASATLTKDFYKGILSQDADDNKLLIAGRISTLLCGTVGFVVAVLFPDLVALSVNSLFMLLVLVPPIVGGFFWSKATSLAAFTSTVIGISVMLGFLAIDSATAFVPGFLASLITFIMVSIFSEHKAEENLSIVRGWNVKS
ncbi:MAG: sodium:solute symporter family protein [Bacteroidota bacterium]